MAMLLHTEQSKNHAMSSDQVTNIEAGTACRPDHMACRKQRWSSMGSLIRPCRLLSAKA